MGAFPSISIVPAQIHPCLSHAPSLNLMFAKSLFIESILVKFSLVLVLVNSILKSPDFNPANKFPNLSNTMNPINSDVFHDLHKFFSGE